MYGRRRYTRSKRNYRQGAKGFSYSHKRPRRNSKALAIRSNSGTIYKSPTFGSKWKNPLPKTGFYKFKYKDSGFQFALAVGNGYHFNIAFHGNSLYDPQYSAGGVQPYGLDSYLSGTSPFQSYEVVASKIKCYFYYGAEVTHPTRVSVYPLNYASPLVDDPSDVSVLSGTKCLCIRGQDTSRPMSLTNYASTKYINGYDNSNNRAEFNANPTFPWYWVVSANTEDTSSTQTLYMDVEIVYYSRLFREDTINES